MKLKVEKTDALNGTITVPGSKSHSVRALLFAALAEMQTGEKSTIKNLLDSDDTRAAAQACNALTKGEGKIHTGNSGITTRFIMPIIGLRENSDKSGSVLLDVDPQMKTRPIQPLIDALQKLGMEIVSANGDGTFPYRISGQLTGGELEVDGSTSQYISALLMSLPAAKNDSVVLVHNLKERSYMEMMLVWLDKLGIVYEHEHTEEMDTFKIPGRQTYKAFTKQIPGDFSSASYPLVAAALLPGEVTLEGLDMTDDQGDKAMVEILQKMGADVEVDADENKITITGGRPLTGLELDANLIPDMLPTLAVLGTQAEGETKIYNVAHARIKETDRIHSMAEGLKAMGADVEEMEDGLIVRKSQLHGAKVNGYSDHRTIMALALAGMLVEESEEGSAKGETIKRETIIDTAEGINKTFPTYVELMCGLGAKMQMQQDHIVIIGFKHAGKTNLGKALAKMTSKEFIDLDDVIMEMHGGGTCREIVQENGEEYFRDLETKALQKTLLNNPAIIALGGGAVMNEENQKMLESELCVYLSTDVDEAIKRIEKKGWPAFVDKQNPEVELRELWDRRSPVYEKLAKITVQSKPSKKETLAELQRQLAEHMQLNMIVGWPLDHTWTPRLHNAAYEKLGLNALMLVNACEQLDEPVENILSWPIGLTVVTMPHKEKIMEHIDWLSEDAKKIGAVNTVINRAGKLTAYNTDVDGIAYALRDELRDGKIKGQKVLLLGAGGAAKAAAYFVNREGGELYCVNRSRDKAEKLMQEYGGHVIGRDEIVNHEFAVIINATPLGMHEHVGESPLEVAEIRGTETVFDMIYNPAETKLLQIAKKATCKTISGLDMFVAQGLKQIELLTGKNLDPKIFIKKLS